jgi:hypothetical protein
VSVVVVDARRGQQRSAAAGHRSSGVTLLPVLVLLLLYRKLRPFVEGHHCMTTLCRHNTQCKIVILVVAGTRDGSSVAFHALKRHRHDLATPNRGVYKRNSAGEWPACNGWRTFRGTTCRVTDMISLYLVYQCKRSTNIIVVGRLARDTQEDDLIAR